MDFTKRYQALNPAQKLAVDTIDGPVMVVAGPGTGKTELLSVRVANILRTTDTLPQNILCLTYTESGAMAMRERLTSLISADAYRVAIHTFHSFGSEVINQYGQYFYNGAHFRPADELSSYEVLHEIFEKLPHDNPLSATMNDEYPYLRDVQRAISDIKKSGLTSDELLIILDKNDEFCEWFQPHLESALGTRLSKKSFPLIETLLQTLPTYKETSYDLITYEPLHQLVHNTLSAALNDAIERGSTKPLGAWKRDWCEKREDGTLTLRDVKRSIKLRAVAHVYYSYLSVMQERSLFDFDDMILRVVHGMEVFDDLRLNLQEQYQYILVDEFQDTNDAQMRLIWNLTNNPVAEGQPNIMVVGDDDQAIYRFQGANLSNILDFRHTYRDVAMITLTDNYRSAQDILKVARDTITQADERLEHQVASIDKTLMSHNAPDDTEITLTSYSDETTEYAMLAKHISEAITNAPNRSRAIIARNHKQLRAMMPYLVEQGIPVHYEQYADVLQLEPVRFLDLLATVIDLIGSQRLFDANALLPELLSHPAWRLDTTDIWNLSLAAHRDRRLWFEVMLATEGPLNDIAQWLIVSAHMAHHEPLEYMIDRLSGVDQQTSDESSPFISPLRDWYFSHDALTKNPTTYVSYLSALSTLRSHLRQYQPDEPLFLKDLVQFIAMYRSLHLSIQSTTSIVHDGPVVDLLSAHRSKGLEYDEVYIISLTDSVWGQTARSRSSLIGYPHNLPIGVTGAIADERIRLLYVALTRAKSRLIMSTHQTNDAGKASSPVSYLTHRDITASADALSPLQVAEHQWHSSLLAIPSHTMHELLADNLSRYKLSATHLGNYLDVTRGGPETFVLQNLLRFPQSMSPSAAYGSAIHATLHRAHGALNATGKRRPIEDLLGDFETELANHQLSTDDFEHFSRRGIDALGTFLAARYDSFRPEQISERNFSTDSIMLGEARITGALDLVDVDESTKTITVTDYKTGRGVPSWKGRTDYERIKLHHYRQQLMFYKLLIEDSRQFRGYTVTRGIIQFVEPDKNGVIHRLDMDYDSTELDEFSTLIAAVWQRIQALDMTLPTVYESSLRGILKFESDITD